MTMKVQVGNVISRIDTPQDVSKITGSTINVDPTSDTRNIVTTKPMYRTLAREQYEWRHLHTPDYYRWLVRTTELSGEVWH